ncbi:hypothetical protein BAY61_14235 [Prauserella marina]|uniref:3-phenylpropionate/cinnamic acid dioxygenase, small subunit n=1 Tax=Prauserella marina TaxID=530584 RepID=A0A222VPX4_9PSEU|nr:aromatic-ring-hydroxylating dioxygenase subunit beta [Prauserella marina]ASR35968.1 hypothetical protein BAY61_14235 [Prauserella marina]PWV84093.1 3-phenylpropionate/cinnamic acid dioxygenase small subunit [Prauserella marina]SDC30500.1 3-phenylpropionate/cinnamic acid dioxygenase, small subunit [Prauserella marina]
MPAEHSAEYSMFTDPDVAGAVELIWREARLLDRRAYGEWEKLWAPGGHYVIPIDPDTTDFESTLNLVYDDERMRRMRVERLTGGHSISASAAATTVRTVSGFVVESVAPGRVRLSSAQVLVAHKRSATTVLAAELTHEVEFGTTGPALALKVVRLVNAREAVTASGYLL